MVDLSFGDLLKTTAAGLYCPAGGFYIDPQRPVERAVVTHAHSDHARYGCRHYLAAKSGQYLLQMRVGTEAEFHFVAYGEPTWIGGVQVTLFPAGHMLGSAQVRLEKDGRIAVVSGDYKLGHDPTCQAWEPVRCHLFVTESTFGLPIYRWRDQSNLFGEVNEWWRESAAQGKCCVLYGYSIGKSQRLLAGLDQDIGPIFTHGAVERGVAVYQHSGVELPETTYAGNMPAKHRFAGSMVIAPPSAHGTSWLRRFGAISTAMASGWMSVRGTRRRRGFDRGFALSDHVDWPSLLQAINECRPESVWVTHGYTAQVATYLNQQGANGWPVHAVALDSYRRANEDEAAEEDAGDEATDSLSLAGSDAQAETRDQGSEVQA